MVKLSLEEVVKLKGYCVKNKNYELGAKLRAEERKLLKKAGTPSEEVKINNMKWKKTPTGKNVESFFKSWEKTIKSIKM